MFCLYFQVFTTAAYDDHKNIVLLAFEIIEKIIRDYFPYITETETTTFTDCVNCLIAFTNNRFNKDISLNAIAFLRFCATKLAEGDLGSSSRSKDRELSGKSSPLSPQKGKDGKHDAEMNDKDNHLYFWFPLLAGNNAAGFASDLNCQAFVSRQYLIIVFGKSNLVLFRILQACQN